MTLLARLKRLGDWLLFHALVGPARCTDVRPGEQAARLTLYPTSRRDVQALPMNAPATLSTSGRSTHGGTIHEQHR